MTSPDFLQGRRDEQDERGRGRGKSYDVERERDGTSSPDRKRTPSRVKSGSRARSSGGGDKKRDSEDGYHREHMVSKMDSEAELAERSDLGFRVGF